MTVQSLAGLTKASTDEFGHDISHRSTQGQQIWLIIYLMNRDWNCSFQVCLHSLFVAVSVLFLQFLISNIFSFTMMK